MSGIFAIMCPECGIPLEFQHDAIGRPADDVADVADGADVDDDVPVDVRVCTACTGAFVVRFGFALAVPCPTERAVPGPTERGAA